MAVIQRPVKTHGTRSYVSEVAAAPDNENPVLANEVDADLDTVYAAWNGGVDTANIKDGAVTVPKLDPAIQGPAQGNFPSGNITLTPRGSLNAAANFLETHANVTGTPNFDNTKPSWMTRMDYGVDALQIWRAPAPGTTWTEMLRLDNAGNMSNPGFSTPKSRSSSLLNQTPFGPIASGNSGPITMNPWIDSGHMAGNSILTAPPIDTWLILHGVIFIDRNGGFGVGLNIEQFVAPSSWASISSILTTTGTQAITVTNFRPATANTVYRLSIVNASGGPVTVTWASFSIGVLGTT